MYCICFEAFMKAQPNSKKGTYVLKKEKRNPKPYTKYLVNCFSLNMYTSNQGTPLALYDQLPCKQKYLNKEDV
nr:hypothetical protein CFP56_63813 [Quercus suber]